MAILDLVTAPDERLNTKSDPIEKVDDAIRVIFDNMLETMYNANGIGLAAVQVGIMKRLLVMDINYGSERYKNEPETKPEPIYMANPIILKSSSELNEYDEGCLSFPQQYANVVRPKTVTIEYLDYDGKKQQLQADDLLATCVQHEIDHLDGINFVDHISKLKRRRIMQKLAKQKG